MYIYLYVFFQIYRLSEYNFYVELLLVNVRYAFQIHFNTLIIFYNDNREIDSFS